MRVLHSHEDGNCGLLAFDLIQERSAGLLVHRYRSYLSLDAPGYAIGL